MRRVALVRGPHLSAYEMQTYTPLQSAGYEFVAFTSEAPLVELPKDLQVRQLPSPMDRIQRSKGVIRMGLEAVAYKRGTASRLEGLEDALASFDIIHPMETFNAFTVQSLDAAKRYGKPTVVTVWENIPFLPVERPFAENRTRVLREADAFIAVTERAKVALLLEGAPEERIHVVPVGLDLARFTPAEGASPIRARLGVPDGALLILFAARLTYEKGLLTALHALRLHDMRAKSSTPAHMVVVGGGDEREAAQARVKELGLEGRVHFEGAVPYARMPEYFQAADAFVMGSVPTPRWQEQYGMVLLEAMASGVPIAVAASGSIPEVVGDAARLTQPGDALDLADAIGELHDPATRERFREAGLRRVRERFDRRVVAQQIDAVYRGL